VRNAKAVLALFVALVALGLFVAAYYVERERPDVSALEAATVVPIAGLLALLALSLSNRARRVHQQTLGRAGGEAIARVARGLGCLALLLTLTACLALAVFAVLETTDGLTRTPW
jgi:hypothetical protein